MALVAAVVGVIAALVIIILVLGVIIIVGCIVRRKRRSYRTEVEHLQDVVLERNVNGTDKSIKLNSLEKNTVDGTSHYQKTQFDLKPRSLSSPPSQSVVPPGGVVVTDNSASYSKLRTPEKLGSTTERDESPAIDEAGYTDVAGLTSSPISDTYDDVRGTSASDGQYSTIDTSIGKQPANSKHQEPIDTPQPREVVYSVVLKNGPPLVPPKTPELYRDLKRENGKAPPNGNRRSVLCRGGQE